MQFPDLSSPYYEYVRSSDWARYVDCLNRDGLLWCLDLNLPTLAAHLMPLKNLPEEIILPGRIGFLSAACHPDGPLDQMEVFFKEFLARKDFDAAVASICFPKARWNRW